MKSAVAVLGITAAVFALPAAAQMNMSAFYVGATVGQSNFKDSCNGLAAGVSAKDTGNGLTFGGGAQWNVMPALGLRAEWQRYSHLGGKTDNGDLDVLSLGGIWRFR